MSRRTSLLLGLAAMVLVAVIVASLPAKAPADDGRDKLPPGAIARIGDVRLAHTNPVECLALAPDGKLLATISHGTLCVWDLATGREMRRLDAAEGNLPRMLHLLAWSPDGKSLALSGQSTGVHLLDAETLKERLTLGADGEKALFSPVFAFAPNGQAIVWWCNDGRIRLYDFVAKKEIHNWLSGRGEVLRFAFAPDGKKLAFVNGQVTTVIDVTTGREIAHYKDEHGFYALTFAPDGKTLAVARSDGVYFWDLTAAKDTLADGPRHTGLVQAIHFAADGKTLCSSSYDGVVKEWDVAAGQEKRSFRLLPEQGFANPVSAAVISPDGQTLAWVAGKNRVRLTKLATGEELFAEENKPQVNRFTFTPDGKYLVTASQDGKPQVWDAAAGKFMRCFENPGEVPFFLSVSGDGKKLVTVGKNIIVWDMEAGKELKRFEHRFDQDRAPAALSPDGKFLALGEVDLTRDREQKKCRVQWWDLEMGKLVAWSAEYHKGSVEALAFAPSGKTLVSAGRYRTICVWEVSTGKQLVTLRAPKGFQTASLAYGDDGKTLLSVVHFFGDAGGRSVRVTEHEPDSAKEGKGHDLKGSSFGAFTPDGSRIAVLAPGGVVRVIDLASEKVVAELKGNQGVIVHVAFSADGKQVATGGRDGTILIWDIARAQKP